MTLDFRALFRAAATADGGLKSEIAIRASVPDGTIDKKNLPRSRRDHVDGNGKHAGVGVVLPSLEHGAAEH